MQSGLYAHTCVCSTISWRFSVTRKKNRNVETVWLMVGTPTPLAVRCSW
jgi:hypothetical protein